MGSTDGMEAFIEVFEGTPEVAPGTVGTHGLPAVTRTSYGDLKCAFLDQLGLTSEGHGEWDRPFAYAHQLLDGVGMLALRPTRAHAAGVPTDGSGADGPSRPGISLREGRYRIPVRIQGADVADVALLDSGSCQTLIHQSLVRPGALLEASWVEIKCVHGDVHKYPFLTIEICFQGKRQ
ncbi:hypothetical protein N1851_000130 [Merluccius polli]|uniref:Uncharacterized protein n=1 Tax=Merluccius polli TaxID=89951 RepID=A0AA47NCQ9_MERPO|nr:hypothetical protein N1851_000130 [Merluccius polli]